MNKVINLCGRGKCCPIAVIMNDGTVKITDDDNRTIQLTKDHIKKLCEELGICRCKRK